MAGANGTRPRMRTGRGRLRLGELRCFPPDNRYAVERTGETEYEIRDAEAHLNTEREPGDGAGETPAPEDRAPRSAAVAGRAATEREAVSKVRRMQARDAEELARRKSGWKKKTAEGQSA